MIFCKNLFIWKDDTSLLLNLENRICNSLAYIYYIWSDRLFVDRNSDFGRVICRVSKEEKRNFEK